MDDEQATGPDPSPPPMSAPPGSFDERASAAAQVAAGPTMRWPMSLISMGIVLCLFALGGWWAQDALGTLANEGEASMGKVVTFQSDGGTYRLLSSGPLRPLAESTYCDITESDGDTHRKLGGRGLQVQRLGVDRLLTFHPPVGETSVTCSFRGTRRDGGGRFQVIDTSSPVTLIPAGLFVAGLLSLLIGAGWGWSVFKRATRPG